MEVESNSINIITAGTLIKGDISASGDFRLDGTLEGNIQLNGKLVVGDSGIVNGNVLCVNANIIGTVNGNLSVKEAFGVNAVPLYVLIAPDGIIIAQNLGSWDWEKKLEEIFKDK